MHLMEVYQIPDGELAVCIVLENILPTLLQLVNTSARNRLTLVLKNGTILEDGSHLELLRANGEYRRMYDMQSRWYQDRGDEIHNG